MKDKLRLQTTAGYVRVFRVLILVMFMWVIFVLGFLYKNSLTSFVELHLGNNVFNITLNNNSKNNNNNQESVGSSPQQMDCSIIDIDPFNPAAMRAFKKRKTINCTAGIPSLISVDVDTLRLNMTKLKLNNIKRIDYCKYLPLKLKVGTDKRLQKLEWSNFSQSIELPIDDDHVLVECYEKDKLVSKEYINLIRKKKEIEERCTTNYKIHVKKNKPSETLSVLLVGIDGMSIQNLARTMPKTRQFILDNLQAIEFRGHNKVGLNTFPNLISLLTGYGVKELLEFWTYHEPMDKIDHLCLWNEYNRAGYRTAMMLDAKFIAAFYYLKRGWAKTPFDYYNRAMILKSIHDGVSKNGHRHCLGKTPTVTVHFDYWLQLASIFNKPTTPYFALSFFSLLTHDQQNSATAGDGFYLDFLQKLWSRNLLNNTLLIFFSDHGFKHGMYRRWFQGKVEANSPFLFFSFPPWFHTKYPEAMSAMRINQRRLVTFFDVHETLRQLLSFKGETKQGSLKNRGINLFDEIPYGRSCDDASIPPRYCKCNQDWRHGNNVTSEMARRLANNLLIDIVKKTDQFRNKCQVLTLKTIHFTVPTKGRYRVVLQTSPGDALYEGLLHNGRVTNVYRLNLYRAQADCLDELNVKPFCYCNNIID